MVSELLNPVAEVKVGREILRFYCPNSFALWRTRTFFDKEPETLAWIDGFGRGDTLLDVGANVGTYTLYAALRGHQVLAIEPEAQNYALLYRNIFLNSMQDRGAALNLGLSDTTHQTVLTLSTVEPAAALHNVEEPAAPKPSTARYQQGILAVTLDDLLGRFSDFFPTHIKIDVDGGEARIIRGAITTLKDFRLRSILIEIDERLDVDRGIVDTMMAYGFSQVSRLHASCFDEGPYAKIYNYVFCRK